MKKYDEFLLFDLPEGHYIVEGTNDNGAPYYNIKSGKSTNNDGEDTYENSMVINQVDFDNSPFAGGSYNAGFSIDGKLDTFITASSKEMNVLFFTANVYTAVMWVRKDNYVYGLATNKIVRDAADGTLENWVDFINSVLASVVLDGTKGEFEKLTAEKLLAERTDLDEQEAKNSDIPIAKPLEGQHTHLDFLSKTKASMSILGGLITVNQTGTEYSFQSIEETAEDTDSSELSTVYSKIAEADDGNFDLVETAHDMAELFRMDVNCFDANHDREQEILNGMIQRAAVYNTFRSFAWTLQAFCEKEGYQPVDLDYATIEELVGFISDRNGLNYVADSYSPAICSGDDLHNYFVPDSVPEDVKKRLLKIANKDAEDDSVTACDIRSLDALRKELDYMYPAIKAIYDELEANRDREEELIGGTADILYAWCSMAYAARQPFFTEDGPMNCWWEHPDNEEDWETKWKIERIKEGIKQSREWVNQHSKDLSKNAKITIKDNIFVFAGVDGLDEWLDILRRLTDLGGFARSAVSGKTNYLVCNPMYAGDSKVKHALEQRIKGKDVKIILLDDFLKAIKMTVKTPEEQLAELRASTEKKPAEKHIKEVKRTTKVVKDVAAEKFTYNDHLQAKGPDYVLDIPDGFVIKEGEEDRDFVAYLPNEEDPDSYLESKFVIFAGQKQENRIFGQLRTVAEYTSIMRGMSNAIGAAFSDSKVVPYERPELPGAIVLGYDLDCLHANAFVGVGNHVQMMRLQISDVSRKNKARYEIVAKNIFDHMTAVTPVELLKSLDAEEFLNMSMDGKNTSEWTDCVQEYVKHLSVARNIWQNALVNTFREQQNSGNANIQQFKKDIKGMLRCIGEYAEAELKKAELVYTLKRTQYPGNNKLAMMKEAVDSLVELATQYVNMNDQQIKVESEFAKSVEARYELSVLESVDQILKNADDSYNKASLEALSNAKAEKEDALKSIEEEKKRKSAEEKLLAEERASKQKAEEERKVAEEKARKERENAERKQYDADYAEWKLNCASVEAKRKAFVAEQLDNEKKRLEQAATDKRDSALATAESVLTEQKKRKTDAENTLASLGLFKFAEKKAQKQIIEDSTKRIADAETAKANAASTYQSEMSSVSGILSTKERSLMSEAERNMPLPVEPEMPSFMKPVAPTVTATQAAKKGYKGAILDHLSDGREYTIKDMMESIPEIMDLSSTRVCTIVRQMVESGDLVREEIKCKAYFKKA